MERYRRTAANKEMLSEEEIKLVKYSEGVILLGVEWNFTMHCWQTSTYEGNWWKGYEIKERWFNCKEDAVSSFRENHREVKELPPPEISKFFCPCDTCRRAYLDKQRSVNQTKKPL